jgi:NhaA family Na+:H+ antiporter
MTKKPRTRTAAIVNRIISPIDSFMKLETSSGIVLVICIVVAMVWANSPWSAAYEHLFHTPIHLKIGNFELKNSFLHWINDGLMVIFFFVIGLEIKRELVVGELSTPRKAALPIFAAAGGMIVPALIYIAFNLGGPGESGWGIPMATDIAFAVGILVLLGKRVPFPLKVFLLALAIVDDLGAVLVIAFFYTEKLYPGSLGMAIALMGLMVLMAKAGVRQVWAYVCIGVFVWLGFLKSGVHSTIAGVALGFITPLTAWFPKPDLKANLNDIMTKFNLAIDRDIANDETGAQVDSTDFETNEVLEEIEFLAKEGEAPLNRLIHALHPWVSFLIMPLFALGNAGVHVDISSLTAFVSNPVGIGVALGLFVGKPIGIILFSFAAAKLNLGSLPNRVTWPQLFAVGMLGGIGFTMALFVSSLAIRQPDLSTFSKMGILCGSLFSAVIGSAILYYFTKESKEK